MVQITRQATFGPTNNTNVGQGVRSYSQSTGLINALNEAGTAYMQRRMKRLQQEEYVRGMQEAAAGASMAEIQANQSFGHKFFGINQAEQGARAYHAQAETSKMARELEEMANNSVAVDPDTFRSQVLDHINQPRTGDAALDAEIMQQGINRLDQVFRVHAKGRHIYQNQAILDQQSQAGNAEAPIVAARLKELVADPSNPVTKTELDKAVAGFRASMLPAPGQDLGMWEDNVAKMLLEQVNKVGTTESVIGEDGQMISRVHDGWNIHAWEHTGIIDALSEENRKKVRDAMDSAQRRLRTNLPPDLANERAKLVAFSSVSLGNRAGDTVNSYRQQLQAFAKEAEKRTGIPASMVFGQEEMENLLVRKAGEITRKEEKIREWNLQRELAQIKAERGGVDDATKLQMQAHYTLMDPASTYRELSDSEFNKVTDALLHGSGDGTIQPLGLANMAHVLQMSARVAGPVRDHLQQSVNHILESPALDKIPAKYIAQGVTDFRTLKQAGLSPDKLRDYYGEKGYLLMTQLDKKSPMDLSTQSLSSEDIRTDLQYATQAAVMSARTRSISKDTRQAAEQVFQENARDWTAFLAADDEVTQYSSANTQQAAKDFIARGLQGIPEEDRAVAGRNLLQTFQQKAIVGDGFVVQPIDSGDGVKSILGRADSNDPMWRPAGGEVLQKAIRDLYDRKLYNGTKPKLTQDGRLFSTNEIEDTVFHEVQGQDGRPVLVGYGYDDNGRAVTTALTLDEIKQEVQNIRKAGGRSAKERYQDHLNQGF